MITLYLVFIFIYLFSDQKIGGVTFLFHSPSFTCDQDSRDSIMLRFNPQAEVHHDQINKDIIREASDALKKIFNIQISEFNRCKIPLPD